MIDIGAPAWCDECGICEQVERRLRVAEETDTEFQFDHCSCDKIDAEFLSEVTVKTHLSISLFLTTNVKVSAK